MYLISLISFSCFAPINKQIIILEVKPIEYYSLQDIEKLLINNNIQYHKIVLAQIRLETGNLSSFLCRENKNLFGMKYPKQRETTALGEYLGHAKYETYTDCIIDYAIWQKNNYIDGCYYSFLDSIGYAEDSDYISKLKVIMGYEAI